MPQYDDTITFIVYNSHRFGIQRRSVIVKRDRSGLFIKHENSANSVDSVRKPSLGRTNHFRNILSEPEFLAGCYLFTVSSSGPFFSHGWPS